MPAAVAAKPRDVTKMKPRELAEELVKIHRQYLPVFDREAELKSALKGGTSVNFKETFPGLGEVSVSAPKPERTEGEAPELIVSAFLELPEKRREKLIADGVVQKVLVKVGAYHGAVRVKTF